MPDVIICIAGNITMTQMTWYLLCRTVADLCVWGFSKIGFPVIDYILIKCIFRLLESHKKLQKLNHELEDKLISVVCESC